MFLWTVIDRTASLRIAQFADAVRSELDRAQHVHLGSVEVVAFSRNRRTEGISLVQNLADGVALDVSDRLGQSVLELLIVEEQVNPVLVGQRLVV